MISRCHMKSLKRLATLFAAALLSLPVMWADENPTVIIHFVGGEQMELDFADRPNISFNSKNALKIKSATMSLKVKAFNTVEKITFGGTAGIADSPADAGQRIDIESANNVAFIGFKPGAPIAVISANGTLCREARVDNDARYTLSLDGLAKGVYIITAGNRTCKLTVE